MNRNENAPAPDQEPNGGGKFGTLEGVFLPNILTMLGVIMYLRQGVVMGEGGLFYGVMIILLAHVVTVPTGLSLSAVSTNMFVRAGGAYYIVSRSLGIEWGGCIGIPLALSQTLAISLHTLGLAESFRMLGDIPSLHFLAGIADYPVWLLGSAALLAMALLSFKGSALVLKTQYVIFALVILSLAVFFAGTRQPGAGAHLAGSFPTMSF